LNNGLCGFSLPGRQCRAHLFESVKNKNSRGAMQLWNGAAMERASGEALFVTELSMIYKRNVMLSIILDKNARI
ncbi:hypothetical protein, partial [Gemmiger formicilis]|uniref:hypothetical protein n=1 Tax=Gemmiger formicilis TaxID=745368 RepID=UPI0035204D44